MPLVSIIIPVYNAEKSVAATINSVLSQSFSDFEIITVNDGSTDKSLEILNTLKESDSRIRVISQKNSGSSVARNTGIKNATGDYIAFCDADDILNKNTIETLYNASKGGSFDLVIGGYETQYFKGNELKKRTETVLEYKEYQDKKSVDEKIGEIIQIRTSPFAGTLFNVIWNKLYKSEIIINNNILFDKSIVMGEDYRFNLFYTEKICSAVVIPDIVYSYKISGDSLSHKFRENDFPERIKNMLFTEKLLTDRNCNEEKYINEKYVAIAFSTFANLHLKQNPLSKKEKKEYFKSVICNSQIVKAANYGGYDSFAVKCAAAVLKTESYFIIRHISYLLYKIRGFK